MKKGFYVTILLCLTFLLTLGMDNLLAQLVPVTIKVTESDLVTGIPGVTVRYGSGSNYTSHYFPGQPTGAGGTIGPVNLNTGTYSFQASYHNGNAVQLNVNVSGPSVTVSFNTETVIMELKSSIGAYLDGGQGRYGSGTNSGTSFWPGGLTGSGFNPTGQTIGQLFPSTYSFEMGYNSTTQVKSNVTIPVGGATLTWTTTNVTLQYSGSISYGGSGDSRFFNKPSMELLPCTRTFHARTGGYFDLTITSGPTMIKSIILLKLKDHNGNPLAGGEARGGNGSSYDTWWAAVNPTNEQGVAVDIRDGLKTSLSYQMLYNNGGQIIGPQDVSSNSFFEFETELVTLRLETCTPLPLDDGHPRFGAGSSYGTSHWPNGNTGWSAPGETTAELFAGTYSFDMQYQATSDQKISQIVPDGGAIFTWQTTTVTLNYSGQISYGGSNGDARFFNKPFMELLSGAYKFHFRDNDPIDLTFSGCDFEYTYAQTGTISGTVSLNGNGIDGVTVMLDNIDVFTTANGGQYNFEDLAPAFYQVEIVPPLGYSSVQNQKDTHLEPGGENTVDFELVQQVIVNDARSKGYWKHQFNVYVKGKGHAQESEANLQAFTNNIATFYNPYYSFFANTNDFEGWQEILSVKGNQGMLAKAKEQLAALVLNFASLKIGQYQLVTADDRTAGDVLTYVSELISGEYHTPPTNDDLELAKDLAEMVNEQQTIDAGIVTPSSNILYRNGFGSASIGWGFGVPDVFSLSQNYPNPFNPVTNIIFAVQQPNHATLKVYNILGQEVATLFNGRAEPDRLYRFNFNGSDLASGVYIYRLQSGENVSTKMMMLTK